MENSSNSYAAGVCNIGPVEIGRRRLLGWFGAIITVAAGAILISFEFPDLWRLALVLPASLSASGFIQARARFCAGFGISGVSNMSVNLGRLTKVKDQESLAKDRKKAMVIMLWASLVGGMVTAGAYAL